MMRGMTHVFPSADELVDNFSFLTDWEERYAYVIDMGKHLPSFPDDQKTEQNIVRGCTSQVWMIPTPTEDGKIAFLADSDAHIVRGLIAILFAVYHGKDKEFVRDFPIEEYFSQLGLGEHLSPSRRNGFFSMVGHIRRMAD